MPNKTVPYYWRIARVIQTRHWLLTEECRKTVCAGHNLDNLHLWRVKKDRRRERDRHPQRHSSITTEHQKEIYYRLQQ
jgi:hypothetical protein